MARGSDRSRSFKIKTACTQLVFSNDARFIGVIGRHVSIGEISTQRIVQKYKELKNPSDVAFSPDSSRIAIKNTSGVIAIMDASKNETVAYHRPVSGDEGCELVFTPDGDTIIDGSWKGLVRAWDARTLELKDELSFKNCQIHQLEFVPSRKAFAFAVIPKFGHPEHRSGRDYIGLVGWPFDPTKVRKIYNNWSGLWRFAFSPDGSHLAVLKRKAWAGILTSCMTLREIQP